MDRHIWASLKPSPLIGRELILVESPQEGAETRHFLLQLGARDRLGEVEAWCLVWQDERGVVQEALKDVFKIRNGNINNQVTDNATARFVRLKSDVFIDVSCSCITSAELCARWRSPGRWRSSGWTQLVMGEQVVQLGGA